jgi:hypothetical protein
MLANWVYGRGDRPGAFHLRFERIIDYSKASFVRAKLARRAAVLKIEG